MQTPQKPDTGAESEVWSDLYSGCFDCWILQEIPANLRQLSSVTKPETCYNDYLRSWVALHYKVAKGTLIKMKQKFQQHSHSKLNNLVWTERAAFGLLFFVCIRYFSAFGTI